MIARIKEMLHSDRMSKRKARIEKAVRAKAAATGDAEFHRVMADYYTARVATIDPDVDWWGFADAKQKEQDNIDLFQKYSRNVEEATARIKAEEVRE